MSTARPVWSMPKAMVTGNLWAILGTNCAWGATQSTGSTAPLSQLGASLRQNRPNCGWGAAATLTGAGLGGTGTAGCSAARDPCDARTTATAAMRAIALGTMRHPLFFRGSGGSTKALEP